MNSFDSIFLRELQRDELSWANEKYDEVGFLHSDAYKDFVAVAEVNGVKAGLGRLVHLSETCAERHTTKKHCYW